MVAQAQDPGTGTRAQAQVVMTASQRSGSQRTSTTASQRQCNEQAVAGGDSQLSQGHRDTVLTIALRQWDHWEEEWELLVDGESWAGRPSLYTLARVHYKSE